jgi:hypothetical protein
MQSTFSFPQVQISGLNKAFTLLFEKKSVVQRFGLVKLPQLAVLPVKNWKKAGFICLDVQCDKVNCTVPVHLRRQR